MSHTSHNTSQHVTSFLTVLSSEMGHVTHVTLYFLKYIYIYFSKNISVTCVTCTILLKNMQKHIVTWGVTYRDTCDVLNFRCKDIFCRKKHLELRITQISESGQLLHIATGKAVSQDCLFQLRIRTAVLKYGG